MWPYELTSRSCWFILVSKSGEAELGEVEDNLLELKNFSITYKTDSSKLASTTSTGSAWLFFEWFKGTNLQLFTNFSVL